MQAILYQFKNGCINETKMRPVHTATLVANSDSALNGI